MNASQSRVPAGVPTGGRFAATTRAEAQVELDPGAGSPRPNPAPPRTLRQYTTIGRLRSEQHLAAGVPVDLPDGTPAYREYHPDGSVAFEKRQAQHLGMGYLPGVEVWHTDPRDGSGVGTAGTDGGRVVRRGRLDIDAEGTQSLFPQDGPGGEPAVTYLRPDGAISSVTRYAGGEWTHTIDFDDAGDPVCVFTNDRNPATKSRTDHVWYDLRIDPRDWAGVTPGQALHYRGAGIGPQEARRWATVTPDAGTALKWRREGRTPGVMLRGRGVMDAGEGS